MNIAILLLAAVAATTSPKTIENPARITSDSTYYDRKEGIAVFKGHVHVDDTEYQLHSEKAYLFMSETNTLSRLAATGSVAITNGLKRAYGEKATYRRDTGLIVLTGSECEPAIVCGSTDKGDQTVRGRKIRFWVNQEQVEVVEADITAPKSGAQNALPSLRQ
mgnify:CR=1 FL=1